MSNIENASPAGEREDDFSSNTPLSMSAAVDLLNSFEDEESDDETPEQQPEEDTSQAPAEEPDEASEGEEEGEPEEPEGEPENEPEADQPLDFEKLHGNQRLRLRDGSEVTVGELKKRWGELQELGSAQTAFQARERQVQEWASQVAQEAQRFQQLAPQAIQAIQASLPQIPEMPDISLRATDPYGYQVAVDDRNRAIEAYNAKVEQMRAIDSQRQQIEQQQSAEAQRNEQDFLRDQRQRLMQAMPELKDEKRRQEFATDLVRYGTEAYGFTEAELAQAYDHRLMLMARDAFAYRKLQANRPKPAAPKKPARAETVPVSQPGRRMTGNESEANRSQSLRARINKPGGLSLSEGAALLEELEED